jgi:tetraacyldisaccharide 4'-kinase
VLTPVADDRNDLLTMAHRDEHSAFREMLEELEQYAVEVILDRQRGLKASLLRGLLWILSLGFRGLVWLRRLLFRTRFILRDHHLGTLVICIGNLTLGGTGKTPVVEMLARALRDRGRRVAILSRGYKSAKPRRHHLSLVHRVAARLSGRALPAVPPRVVSDGRNLLLDSRLAGDEPFMLARNLPDVSVVVDKDRVKGGLHAIRELGADTLVLDDGLQYLRLRHRIDIVLIDSTAPFGNEHLLPRGTLREPRRQLKRASYILITKCDGPDNSALIARLRRYNRVAEIIECRHQPKYLVNAVTQQKKPLDLLKGKYVGTISGIAVPEGFEQGLRRLGAIVDTTRRFTDHHRFTEDEVYNFIEHCERRDCDLVVTTEKDFVRFPPLPYTDLPVLYLRVQIQILTGHEAWGRLVDRLCAGRKTAPRTGLSLAPM